MDEPGRGPGLPLPLGEGWGEGARTAEAQTKTQYASAAPHKPDSGGGRIARGPGGRCWAAVVLSRLSTIWRSRGGGVQDPALRGSTIVR